MLRILSSSAGVESHIVFLISFKFPLLQLKQKLKVLFTHAVNIFVMHMQESRLWC